ncbi:MAG: (d)CMP kinase [Fusobacteriaceae bacterium]|jgi:cytidylate kinase|nr:(d)CMP kinase [Fusobacteriaceae bacterium]
MENFVVAIDGPAGSGKSTIAKIIANRYNFIYLDTGAMYRMVAYYFIENNIDLKDEKNIQKLIENIELDVENNKFFLNGEDVSEKIRTPKVNSIVSSVSAIKKIRIKLVEQQRKIGFNKKIILDGRDIGTVVFPNADIKIFLIASPEERANRRYKEYIEKGIKEDYQKVFEDIKKRDYLDSTREESPLVKANDAIEIDTSSMTIDEVVENISKYIDKKFDNPNIYVGKINL